MAIRGFDFTGAMQRLCDDVVARTPDLSHVQMPQVAVVFAQARHRELHGLQAKLTPMRFEAGALTCRRAGTHWTVRRMFDGDREILYILTFYLPRFLDQPVSEKLITVFHELFHISPRFDGDIRRMEGRYHVHSHSQKEYDRQMAVYSEQYLASRPKEETWGFLRWTFSDFMKHHGGVIGRKVPIPKLVRLPEQRSA